MKLEIERLKELTETILKGLGESDDNARLAARALVRADMRGIPTHGTYLLIPIAGRIKEKMLTIPTKTTVISDEGATTILDGGNGLGQIAAQLAMENSIKKARKYGIGITMLRNTNNVGFLGNYTELAACEDLIGIAGGNAAPAIAPWGGTEAYFGTNPISIGVPTEEDPLILDMSSSVVARGKIRRALRNEEEIPEGWAIDEDGELTTDPAAALKGTLLPIGGPKGSGLAMMIDILAGMLSGAKYGPAVKSFHQPGGLTGVGIFCLAIDIEYFLDREKFREMITAYIDELRNIKKARNCSRIYLPGEIESLNEVRSRDEGVNLDQKVVEGLNRILDNLDTGLRI